MNYREWITCRLDQIADVNMGQSPNSEFYNSIGDGLPFLQGNRTFGYLYPTFDTFTTEVKKYAKKGDVLMSVRAPVGDLNMAPTDLCIGRGVCSLRMKNGNNRFLFYLLKSNITNILKHETGSVFGSINGNDLKRMETIIPSDINEQNRITYVLANIDDKIEINSKINKTLEEAARSIFKSWFVDFEPFRDCEFVESEVGLVPKGWDIVTLERVTSKFATGLNPRKNFRLGEGDNFYVTIKNMQNNDVILDRKCDSITNEALLKINARSDLQIGDALFSGIGTIGRVFYIDEKPNNWNISESVFTIRSNSLYRPELLYYLLLSDKFQEYAKSNASGSVQKGIRMADLKRYKFALPPNEITNHVGEILNSLIKLIKKNNKENEKLKNLRDFLLPKLMSGEIRVPIMEES